ncbi:LysR substrate-binding domain-containing protein [Heliomarina baculiformis]|uniref:LysR substrate-binding domain-containing protein n=1 Tax=Heliomarina baculiformis TaxID=2872036 RepID=UPI0023535F54|nr:LysR substrate-binding domain-containing protein [Heliomarina baculiformis]
MRIGSRHLPLNALQGFESAGRHLNMRAAGEELNVTQSAISHQVRSIEKALGKALFEPNRRRLVLTDDGKRLLSAVREALDGITATALQLGEDAYAGTLTVAAPPAFSTQWLIPRLPRFLAHYPDLSLTLERLSTQGIPLPKVDVAVAFNAIDFPGMRVKTLAELEMFPVCAPSLLPTRQMQPEQLRDATLIHEDGGAIWSRWFAATGADPAAPRRSIHVASTQDALALARAGAGFAINDPFMGGHFLTDGTLVRPFGELSFTYGQYSLVTSPPERLGAAASAFADWLMREIAATPGHR